MVVGTGSVFGFGCGVGHEGTWAAGTGAIFAGGEGSLLSVFGEGTGGSSGNTRAGKECGAVGFHAVVEWQSAHVVGNRECPGKGLVS